MSERYNIDFVKTYYTKRNCELLEDVYINASTSMKFKCSCGNITSTSFSGFRKSSNCKNCSKTKRPTYDELKKYYLDQECELLEDFYLKASIPMKYRCKCGNIAYMNLNNFRKGKRCKKCSGLKTSIRCKADYNYINKYINSYNYILDQDYYINAHTKLKLICPNNHIQYTTFNSFQQGLRCATCSKRKKYSQQEIVDYFVSQNCEFLDIYKNGSISHKYKCECGNISYINFDNFRKGQRCKQCGIAKSKITKFKNYKKPIHNGYTSADIQYFSKIYKRRYKIKYNIPNGYHIHHLIYIKTFLKYGISDLDIINNEFNLIALNGEYHIKLHKLIKTNTKNEFLKYMSYINNN